MSEDTVKGGADEELGVPLAPGVEGYVGDDEAFQNKLRDHSQQRGKEGEFYGPPTAEQVETAALREERKVFFRRMKEDAAALSADQSAKFSPIDDTGRRKAVGFTRDNDPHRYAPRDLRDWSGDKKWATRELAWGAACGRQPNLDDKGPSR